jgi:hypothetical protein
MITNANQGGLNGLLAERALLISRIRRALSATNLDIKALIERELNVAFFPYEIWVSLPDLRQRYQAEDTPYLWVLDGDFSFSAATLFGPHGEEHMDLPMLRAELHPRDGLRCANFHLGAQNADVAKKNLDFAHLVVQKLEVIRGILDEANKALQEPIASARADYKRLEMVNIALREITDGTHGKEVWFPLLEEHEPFNLDFTDEDGGLPPF